MKRVISIFAAAVTILAGACAKHDEVSSRGKISLLAALLLAPLTDN
jgi:hypothetical protein